MYDLEELGELQIVAAQHNSARCECEWKSTSTSNARCYHNTPLPGPWSPFAAHFCPAPRSSPCSSSLAGLLLRRTFFFKPRLQEALQLQSEVCAQEVLVCIYHILTASPTSPRVLLSVSAPFPTVPPMTQKKSHFNETGGSPSRASASGAPQGFSVVCVSLLRLVKSGWRTPNLES